MLPKLVLPFKLGLGAVIASGSQYISWIHIQDMVNGILFLIDTPEARGAFNFTSPNPITNRRFAKVLSRTLFRPCLFKIPSFVIKMMMGESATLLIDGQRAIPQHLLDKHYRFAFEHIDEALADILVKKI
jgi:Predicted nucleoside-diphosphate sugar epimerase